MTATAAPTGVGWTVDDSTFGARLALVRQRMDWNIKEAARECGLPAASWRTWERDGVSPRNKDDIAWQIAARTGCDYGWLLGGSRLTSYRAGIRPENDRQVTERYHGRTKKTRPDGHPKGTHPDSSTRRPHGLRAAHALS